MSAYDSPIPLSDIETVLAWVDTFKLSRPTKKINRDFSDAVLLAEILSVHYPKLVEMHNYPPRNSHSLKLNNWMTLNRKVLKKLRLNLCSNTMEQLANCAPGVIERVLVMVRDKIRRDEDANRSLKESEQNVSSGGSYYEACGDEAEHVLVVPVKTRVNGVLETIQQKVVHYETHLTLKEELKDAKETVETLKQKVEHLDKLLNLKEERIEELQKQLERKQTKRKEVEALQNSLAVPFEPEPPTPKIIDLIPVPSKTGSSKSLESTSKVSIESNKQPNQELSRISKEDSKIPIPKPDIPKCKSKPSITDVDFKHQNSEEKIDVDRIKSDVFKEIEITDDLHMPPSVQEFITIENSIRQEVQDICDAVHLQDTS
ncbi:unnamed protein product [Danaus chrysippus]|uniref:(African queen) hypothetical protein n=1 Tax=Danaus chrysippus TaxID=151541 RepID=A0A8J2QSZ8_9NEOP|nr:unnamed protein product [Danaus chrysippus]